MHARCHSHMRIQLLRLALNAEKLSSFNAQHWHRCFCHRKQRLYHSHQRDYSIRRALVASVNQAFWAFPGKSGYGSIVMAAGFVQRQMANVQTFSVNKYLPFPNPFFYTFSTFLFYFLFLFRPFSSICPFTSISLKCIKFPSQLWINFIISYKKLHSF